MRKIEKEMIQAVNNKAWFKKDNTKVEIINNNVFVFLYGNLICAQIKDKKYFSNCGYNTVTTASRLRALGADYSRNEKKCNCDLHAQSELLNMYYKNLFRIN